MPTTRVPAYRCGTIWSGWLNEAHPTVEDGKLERKVCFSDRSTGCKYEIAISVKKLWILLHLQTLPFYLSHTLLWYRLNGKQEIL